MPWALALAVLLLSATSTVASYVPLDPKDGAILPLEVSMELLRQCSRGAPQNVTGNWLPSARQVRELEARLPAALEAIAFQRGSRYAQPANFRRQYAGYTIKGRKIIYMNAFPPAIGDPEPNGPPGARHFDWHRQIVDVCDGGPAFFGVEYDLEKKAFSHFEFNGFP